MASAVDKSQVRGGEMPDGSEIQQKEENSDLVSQIEEEEVPSQ